MYGIQVDDLNIADNKFFILSRVHEFNIPVNRADYWKIDKISAEAKANMEKLSSRLPYEKGFVDVSLYEDPSYTGFRNNKDDLHIINVVNKLPFRLFAIQTMTDNDFSRRFRDWLTPIFNYPIFNVLTRKANLMYISGQELPHHHFKIYEYATSFNDVARFGEYGFQT